MITVVSNPSKAVTLQSDDNGTFAIFASVLGGAALTLELDLEEASDLALALTQVTEMRRRELRGVVIP